MKRNAPGFTLIELMVVVAIIGVLAAIAIPQFLIFSWKAKRSEGIISLNAVYIAETSYFSSYDQYAKEQSPNEEGLVLARLGLAGLDQDLKYYGKYCAALPSCFDIGETIPPGPGFRVNMHAKLDKDSLPSDWMLISSETQLSGLGKPLGPGQVHLFYDDIFNQLL